MAVDIEKIGIKVVEESFKEICKETKTIMRSKAPYPTGASRGKGSMSKGLTRRKIGIHMIGKYHAIIAPLGKPQDYAYYAENGRGSITKPYYMKFRGADGKIHRAKHVAGMEGWHFVAETAKIIRAKYGAK